MVFVKSVTYRQVYCIRVTAVINKKRELAVTIGVNIFLFC